MSSSRPSRKVMDANEQLVQNGGSEVTIKGNVVMGKKFADKVNSDFGQTILRALSENPNIVGMIDAESGEKVTFAEMKTRSVRCALWLRKQGVEENDVVGLSTPIHMNDYVPYLATFYINAIINPSHYDASIDQVQQFFETCRPKVMFACGESIDKLIRIAKDKGMDCKFVTFDKQEGHLSLDEIMAEQTQDEIDDFNCSVPLEPRKKVSQIVFSSGTTSTPKAVMLSYHRLLSRQMEECGMRERMVCLWYSPFAWIAGGIFTLAAIRMCSTRVVHRAFDVEETAAIVEKYKINFIFLRPCLLMLCHEANICSRYNFEHVEIITFGGTKSNKVILKECQKSLPRTFLLGIYGTTEGAFLSSHTKNRKHIDSAGYPLNGVKLKVVDPNTGVVLGPHQIGEIYYQTDNAMLGYLNDSQETESTMDEEGWLKSGDLGYYDDDGEVFIGDRLKAMIKTRLHDYSPFEFEETLMQHPAVHDCAVVGVDHPIDIERPFIFVVKSAEVSAEELIEFAASEDERYRLTGGLVFVDKLPYTQNGKKHLKKLLELAKDCVEQKRGSNWSYVESKFIKPVIIGARIEIVNNIFHIKIKQAALLPNGRIDPKTKQWKNVDNFTVYNNNIRKNIDYHEISREHVDREVLLDDLDSSSSKYKKDHVLTGLRFHKVDGGESHGRLKLAIFLSPFNYTTGLLDSVTKPKLHTAKEGPRKRAELPMRELDLPIKHKNNGKRSTVNTFFRFYPSSLATDVGQTIVPFIDTQLVEPNPPVPLSGAGLFLRADDKEKSGGYLALKFFTFDTVPYLKDPNLNTDSKVLPINEDDFIK